MEKGRQRKIQEIDTDRPRSKASVYLGNGHVIQWWYNSKDCAFSKMPPHRNSFLEAVTITEVEVMAEAKVRCCQSFGRPRTGFYLPPEMIIYMCSRACTHELTKNDPTCILCREVSSAKMQSERLGN